MPARLKSFTRMPWRSIYSPSVVRPSGYISKIGVDGTMSDTGPKNAPFSRKSYTDGACTKVRSICAISFPISPAGMNSRETVFLHKEL